MAYRRTIALLVPMMVWACDDEFNYNNHSVEVEGEGIEAVVSVMEGSCAGCHTGESSSAGLDLTTDFCGTVLDGRIVVPGDSASSVLYQRISNESAPMPPSGLMDQANIDIVRDWIDAGADCDGTDTGGAAPTGADLFASRCASCHGASGQGVSGPALASVAPSYDQSSLENVILNGSGSMPPITVTEAEASLIAEYVLATFGG